MLEIKNLTKIYDTGDFKQKALDGVSVNFRKCEFASILGPSGSGKTTFLNIIGGLDHYTSGDLIINEISTKKFKDSDWDSYRNHRIGFVFQSYNLISHQTILANVKLALTLSGISKKEANDRAKKALKDVGLEKHINKRPNQLSGGQMQRVAIARALVNDPDILLADEPTGALDSETSVQIMDLLKKIAKTKLVIMVTHNPELAEEYSNRIITLKDGKITSDSNPYDGKVNTKDNGKLEKVKQKKTSMSFKTALALSFNNLMTKKGRTVLVAVAGSIGIIGIALILAVSTGFQNYIDSIQEDTLTSYPLSIMQESTDITGALLSMRANSSDSDGTDKVVEQQYITSTLSSVRANDLKSFKKYLEDNYSKVDQDIASVKYSYSIDPLIYTYDATGKMAKLNPSSLFSSMYSGNMMSSFSSFTSVFSQMIDDKETINEQYDILAGRLPKHYNEMVIVLSEPNSISDLLVYSLGLRDTSELSVMINKIMTGDTIDINNEPLTFTYDDLMNVELKLVMPADTYKYNSKYDVYEDMSLDEEFMKKVYDNAIDLKIVGIVAAKPGTTTMALNPGVAYSSSLIEHIINYSKNSEIVKRQLDSHDIDIFSGNRFDAEKSNFDFSFTDLVSIDEEKLKEVFDIKIDKNDLENQTMGYIQQISKDINVDTAPAYNDFLNTLNDLVDGLIAQLPESIGYNDIDIIVNNYLNTYDAGNSISVLESNYAFPKDKFIEIYSGTLKTLLKTYIDEYNKIDSSNTVDPNNPIALVNTEILSSIKEALLSDASVIGATDTISKYMTEALMQRNILTKVGELAANLTNSFASAFNIDQSKFAECFSLNFSEDELMRVVSALMNKSKTTLNTNLISLGYQDMDNPTIMSFYFNSFEGKEDFLSFIDSYNSKMKKNDKEDKVINYSDTTGILMGSVKTIVNAVSYVLIAFVSISLVVSSIMIGVITYISVYERTKEIGILRSIGASKKNISSIFNAETFIIGFLSGIFGIGISYGFIPIINAILHHFTGNIPLAAKLNIKHGLILVVLSIILTLIGGLIPARSASKKDPVEALRSE